MVVTTNIHVFSLQCVKQHTCIVEFFPRQAKVIHHQHVTLNKYLNNSERFSFGMYEYQLLLGWLACPKFNALMKFSMDASTRFQDSMSDS